MAGSNHVSSYDKVVGCITVVNIRKMFSMVGTKSWNRVDYVKRPASVKDITFLRFIENPSQLKCEKPLNSLEAYNRYRYSLASYFQ